MQPFRSEKRVTGSEGGFFNQRIRAFPAVHVQRIKKAAVHKVTTAAGAGIRFLLHVCRDSEPEPTGAIGRNPVFAALKSRTEIEALLRRRKQAAF